MALSDITLADGQASPVNHVFTFVNSSNGRVLRSEISAPAEEPLIMTHAHSERKSGSVKITSHLLRIDKTILDSDGITAHTANIRVMCDIPTPISSDALAADLAAFIRNWATADNVKQWVKGSVG